MDASELVADNHVSKDVDDYSIETLTVAALKRTKIEGLGLSPGQHVRYVGGGADARGAARVRLEFEDLDRYDVEWHEDATVRAVESVLAPIGWHGGDIRQYLSETNETTLIGFTDRTG